MKLNSNGWVIFSFINTWVSSHFVIFLVVVTRLTWLW